MKCVVIGAGVIGSSIALQLCRGGHEVTVIDRNSKPGQGSTSASSAVVRFNYSTFDAVALSWESYHLWRDWKKFLGPTTQNHYAEMVIKGYVMLDVPVISWDNTVELFTRAGIPFELWDSQTLKARLPGIDNGKYWPPKPVKSDEFWSDSVGELGGIYTPDGGYVSDPLLATENLATSAENEGVNFVMRRAVTAISKNVTGRINGLWVQPFQDKEILDQPREFIEADVIVNVAGPWSTKINAMAGAGRDFTVEVRPMRQEVHQIATPKDILPGPAMGDLDLGTYLRSGPGGITLVGGTEPECDPLQWVDDVDSVNMTRTVESFEAQAYRLARRFPVTQVPSTPTGVVGVYDVSSDWTPIYDKTDVPGFYVAMGTSGNQFKNAPGVGLVMADLISKIEGGQNHDSDPVIYTCQRTELKINMAAFSRKRPRNERSSGTVMG